MSKLRNLDIVSVIFSYTIKYCYVIASIHPAICVPNALKLEVA